MNYSFLFFQNMSSAEVLVQPDIQLDRQWRVTPIRNTGKTFSSKRAKVETIIDRTAIIIF